MKFEIVFEGILKTDADQPISKIKLFRDVDKVKIPEMLNEARTAAETLTYECIMSAMKLLEQGSVVDKIRNEWNKRP